METPLLVNIDEKEQEDVLMEEDDGASTTGSVEGSPPPASREEEERPPLRELRVRLVQVTAPERVPNEPVKSHTIKARPRTPMLNWVSAAVNEKVENHITGDAERRRCQLCKDATQFSRRRIRIHVRQHFCLM